MQHLAMTGDGAAPKTEILLMHHVQTQFDRPRQFDQIMQDMFGQVILRHIWTDNYV